MVHHISTLFHYLFILLFIISSSVHFFLLLVLFPCDCLTFYILKLLQWSILVLSSCLMYCAYFVSFCIVQFMYHVKCLELSKIIRYTKCPLLLYAYTLWQIHVNLSITLQCLNLKWICLLKTQSLNTYSPTNDQPGFGWGRWSPSSLSTPHLIVPFLSLTNLKTISKRSWCHVVWQNSWYDCFCHNWVLNLFFEHRVSQIYIKYIQSLLQTFSSLEVCVSPASNWCGLWISTCPEA